MKKMVRANSGHSLFVKSITRDELPKGLFAADQYKTFDDNGVVFMYLGRGHEGAPGQIVAWYAKSKQMWSSYGKTIEHAINGAQEDGWMYA